MGEKLPILGEPPLGAYEMSPRVWIKALGPTGLSAGLPVVPASSGGLSWAALSGPCWSWPVLACLNWVLRLHLVHLSLNRRSDIFCDFISGQSVLSICILAQKHNLHFLEGEV